MNSNGSPCPMYIFQPQMQQKTFQGTKRNSTKYQYIINHTSIVKLVDLIIQYQLYKETQDPRKTRDPLCSLP